MGPECTAKALTHRIAKIKSTAAGAGGASTAGPSTATSTPRRTRAPASGGRNRKSAGKAAGKKGASAKVKPEPQGDDEDEEDYDNMPAGSPVASPSVDRSHMRRGASANIKRGYAESSDEEEEDVDEEEADAPVSKRAKREDSAKGDGEVADSFVGNVDGDFREDSF